MNAESRTIRDLLGSQGQYIIPLFQREYVWTSEEWRVLWEDTCSVAFDVPSDGKRKISHFFGSIVMVPYDPAPGRIPQFFVIDGQQRLTTTTIILMALRDLATESNLPLLAREIQSTYITHEFKKGDESYKLFLRDRDRIPYLALLEKRWADGRKRLTKAYWFFKSQAKEIIDAGEPAEDVLTKLKDATTGGLEVVAIRLTAEDNPFEIFASLNFKGVDLTEADLIRNYVFMHVKLDEQDQFAQECWDPFDAGLTTLGTLGSDPSTFYRHYLQRNGGGFIPRNGTYAAFEREYKRDQPSPQEKVADLQSTLDIYLGLLNPSRLNSQEYRVVRSELRLLNSLDVSTCYPLLLNLFRRTSSGSLSMDQLQIALSEVNSFVVRRAMCSENARAYNKWFVEMVPPANEADPVTFLRRSLIARGWPEDSEFRRGLLSFKLYERPGYCKAVIERLLREQERELGGERADVRECQVEHVLPQTVNPNDAKGQAWIAMLGEEWFDIHSRLGNTLANLTLLGKGLNFEASNDTFEKKKPILAKSRVLLNRHFDQVESWNEEQMLARLAELALLAYAAFPRPAADSV